MTEAGPHALRSQRHGATTRGFMFADLRGYTEFVERHGAHRSAVMLDRYRALVRAAVAEFDGAEIRTEGDSFYVVFDSASAAIECGLAVVERAKLVPAAEPASAFHVGVGIHAGETVETAEGYVGSAVNTAARICAQAGPNQVLVSGTVRALTAGVVDASFVPVGRRRLKGIRDPIELYRAVGGSVHDRPRTVLPARLLSMSLGLIGAVVVTAVAAAVITQTGNSSSGGAGEGSDGKLIVGSVEASPSSDASVTPGGGAGVYPDEHETELLALIPESEWDRCERAASADLPVLDQVSVSGVPPVTRSYKAKISVWGGIHCRLGGISAPDDVWYWRVGFRSEVAEYLAQQAPKAGAESGSCDAEPAVERWSFGDGSGTLLCHTTVSGDAVLNWSYDQANLFGRAIRDDRDMAALLRWWEAEARFLPTE